MANELYILFLTSILLLHLLLLDFVLISAQLCPQFAIIVKMSAFMHYEISFQFNFDISFKPILRAH